MMLIISDIFALPWKILKVIKKKLVRKALDMIKKIDAVDYVKKFWKEYSTK